ncbi:MAG: DUF309 domain-containing protein [Candidatus Methylomirabilia bacterium]
MALPLPLRNRLAELILDALREPEAKAVLDKLDRHCRQAEPGTCEADPPARFPMDFFDRREGRLVLKETYLSFRDELCERVSRACAALRERPLSEESPSLSQILVEAAALFDARLHFEVHELLEPYWLRAQGDERQILQGLIQVAVGYHHLANGNLPGARALLEEGSAKLVDGDLGGFPLRGFALKVRQSLAAIDRLGIEGAGTFDWSLMPRFQRESTHGSHPSPQ